jgi:hypothetical protein
VRAQTTRKELGTTQAHAGGLSARRELLLAAVVIVASLAILVLILKFAGLLTFSRSTSGATIVAAAIALVGTFFTAVIGFMGVILKRSLDLRSLALQVEAQTRSHELQQLTEQRLRLETAVKAVELFGKATTAESRPQVAGALFALTQLRQFEFALGLTDTLLSESKLDAPSAVWIIDQCLLSDSPSAQEHAAQVLRDHAHRLTDVDPSGYPGSYYWPGHFNSTWDQSLPWMARMDLLTARAHLILSRPLNLWTADRLGDHAFLLALALDDPDPTVSNGATLLVHELLFELGDAPLYHRGGSVSVRDLRRRVAERIETATRPLAATHGDLSRQLFRWRTGASTDSV